MEPPLYSGYSGESMARTKAQGTPAGKKNYGKNYSRGRAAEKKAAASLRKKGYTAKLSPGSKGRYDIIAKKGTETLKIQVKRITSRGFSSVKTARARMKGPPFNVKAGTSIQLTDAAGKVWKFKV